jgi:arsenite methyltransferase
MTDQNEDLRSVVRATYGERAREAASSPPGVPAAGVASLLYGSDANELPETVVSYGCGNPVAIAGLQPGEVVLDLGSGAGLDCFLASRQVGASGRVIGLDMTDEMLALAEQNRAKLSVDNVEFRKGLIEEIPLRDASVDVIISNCVINLSTDKDAVFRESFRTLKPGGRFQIADVVLRREISEAERADVELWAMCKSGALVVEDYAARLRSVGFVDVHIAFPDGGSEAAPWASALVNARRPGGPGDGKPWLLPNSEQIELLSSVSLATGDCCGTYEGRQCC